MIAHFYSLFSIGRANLQLVEERRIIHEERADDDGRRAGQDGKADAVLDLQRWIQTVADWNRSCGNGENVCAVGGNDGPQDIRDGVDAHDACDAGHDRDGNRSGGRVARKFGEEAGEGTGNSHGHESWRKLEAYDDDSEAVDGARFNDETAQSKTTCEEENHASHGVAFRVLPVEHRLAIFITQEEHQHADDEEDVSRLHGRKG